MDELTQNDEIDTNVINDEEANELYMKVSTQTQGRKGYVKKNWTEDETKLLKWAVLTYTKQRNITYHLLVSAPSLVSVPVIQQINCTLMAYIIEYF